MIFTREREIKTQFSADRCVFFSRMLSDFRCCINSVWVYRVYENDLEISLNFWKKFVSNKSGLTETWSYVHCNLYVVRYTSSEVILK